MIELSHLHPPRSSVNTPAPLTLATHWPPFPWQHTSPTLVLHQSYMIIFSGYNWWWSIRCWQGWLFFGIKTSTQKSTSSLDGCAFGSGRSGGATRGPNSIGSFAQAIRHKQIAREASNVVLALRIPLSLPAKARMWHFKDSMFESSPGISRTCALALRALCFVLFVLPSEGLYKMSTPEAPWYNVTPLLPISFWISLFYNNCTTHNNAWRS